MDAKARLESLGIAPEVAATLVAHALAPPDGVLDPGEPRATSEPVLLLHAALIAALDARTNAGALRAVLAELEAILGEVSSYDAARFWHIHGLAAWRLDDSAFLAARRLNTAARILIADGEPRALRYLARVHDTFAQLLHQQGMVADARRELERSLELRDEVGDRVGAAISLGNLGRLCMDIGDFAAAATYFARDLVLVEETTPHASRVRAQVLNHLAEAKLQLGDVEAADQLLASSAEIARGAYDLVGEAFAAIGAGRVRLARKDPAGALRVVDEALARLASLELESRTRASVAAAAAHLSADAKLASGRYADAIADYRTATEQLGAATSASPIEHAEILRGQAIALAAQRQHADSARSLRHALKHLDASAADGLRRQVESELQTMSYDSWLLHSAGRFIGQHHIEFLLSEAGQAGFRGAKRRVIVMFSDIRGFTSLSERMPPEELILLLNDYLAQMTRCIERHGGMVDKFLGDGIMAIFPADDANPALAAALAMNDELERFNRGLGKDAPKLTVGIGLHAGEVIAGLIGSPQKREYTVIGDVVNTAARLESMTKQLGAMTLASASVVELADPDRFWLRPVGTFAPKGRTVGLPVFDVMGERDRSPQSRGIAAEIERVEAALASFRARELAAAAAAFTELERDFAATPRRSGYALLAAKARELIASPPPASWAGEIALVDK